MPEGRSREGRRAQATDRRELQGMLKAVVAAGDVVMVTRIDRLARIERESCVRTGP